MMVAEPPQGNKGQTGDCACRAIAIATSLPYQQVYDALNEAASTERMTKRRRKKSNARTGIHKDTCRKYLKSLGWRWIPTMSIGKGCTVHLRVDELPAGRIIVQVSHHYTAVIDGVIVLAHVGSAPHIGSNRTARLRRAGFR